jgi:hypothetical protein
MSEMAPEAGGGGGSFLTAKVMGLPWIAWIGIVAVGAYLFLAHKSASSSATTPTDSSTGGSGTITTGATTIDTGAVQISVSAPNASPPQPSTGSGTGTSGGGGSTTSQQVQVSDLTETVKNGSAAAIEWRPPQWPSGTPSNATYSFGISPAPKGGASGMHNIGSRTSYNVGGLKKGTQYTATVTPNVSGAVPAQKTFTFQG